MDIKKDIEVLDMTVSEVDTAISTLGDIAVLTLGDIRKCKRCGKPFTVIQTGTYGKEASPEEVELFKKRLATKLANFSRNCCDECLEGLDISYIFNEPRHEELDNLDNLLGELKQLANEAFDYYKYRMCILDSRLYCCTEVKIVDFHLVTKYTRIIRGRLEKMFEITLSSHEELGRMTWLSLTYEEYEERYENLLKLRKND